MGLSAEDSLRLPGFRVGAYVEGVYKKQKFARFICDDVRDWKMALFKKEHRGTFLTTQLGRNTPKIRVYLYKDEAIRVAMRQNLNLKLPDDFFQGKDEDHYIFKIEDYGVAITPILIKPSMAFILHEGQ